MFTSTFLGFFIYFNAVFKPLKRMNKIMDIFTDLLSPNSAYNRGLPYVDIRRPTNLHSWFYARLFLLVPLLWLQCNTLNFLFFHTEGERRWNLFKVSTGIALMFSFLVVFFLVFIIDRYGPNEFMYGLTRAEFFYFFVLLCIFLLASFIMGTQITNNQSSHKSIIYSMKVNS